MSKKNYFNHSNQISKKNAKPANPTKSVYGRNKVENKLRIIGARVNNLKNISLEIPRNKLVVITGLSGSGKSSLAFDVIYAEGRRRYLESLSSYARQFLEMSEKPDVDKIENLSPAISINQKSVSKSPRSTVGTLTEVYDYLRTLYAKIGIPYCPNCGLKMVRKSKREILKELLALPNNTQIAILAQVKRDKNKNLSETLKSVSQLGYARVKIEGKIKLIKDILLDLEDKLNSEVEIVIDRITLEKNNPDQERILDSIETAFKVGQGFMSVYINNTESKNYSQDFVCDRCHFKISKITPKHFSFNNPEGACPHCYGLGVVQEVDADLIMPNKNLSLAEGAILPLAKFSGYSNSWKKCLDTLEKIGKKKGFSIDEPIKNISKNNLNIIL
ncbi:MAG TPA: excinuclease ABC subunit UvrA, partial [Candidatus Moranbacteria bacterium]|nr:excinuclease ABC subunit UvrA [Candidatus Moranbacteria bacterium]